MFGGKGSLIFEQDPAHVVLLLPVSWPEPRPALLLGGSSCPPIPSVGAKPCTWTQRCQGTGSQVALLAEKPPAKTLMLLKSRWQQMVNQCRPPAQAPSHIPSVSPRGVGCSSLPVRLGVNRGGGRVWERWSSSSARLSSLRTIFLESLKWGFGGTRWFPLLPMQSLDCLHWASICPDSWLMCNLPLPSAWRFFPPTAQVTIILIYMQCVLLLRLHIGINWEALFSKTADKCWCFFLPPREAGVIALGYGLVIWVL